MINTLILTKYSELYDYNNALIRIHQHDYNALIDNEVLPKMEDRA